MNLEDQNILGTIYKRIFKQEYPDLLLMLERFGEVKHLDKGTSIYKEGAASVGFYMVLDGYLKVCRSVNTDAEQIITILSSGDFSGLSAVMNDHAYHKKVTVLEGGAIVVFLPKASFFSWMEKHPGIVIPLLKQVEAKIDRIENRATFITRKTIEQRLAYSILYLKNKFGVDDHQFLNLKLTPQDFANFIGTTRTTVYRVFKRFENSKLINIHNKKIMLLDSNGLEEMQSQTLV